MIHRKYLTAELAFAEWVLREAYRECFAGNCEKVTQKGSFDLVSAADVAVERFVAEQIHARSRRGDRTRCGAWRQMLGA